MPTLLALLTPVEVADLLGVSTETLTTWRRAGEGPNVTTVDREIFYRPGDVERFIRLPQAATASGAHAPSAADPNALLTAPEAAERLRSSAPTLARWRTDGTGPRYIKRGHQVFYTVADLDSYLSDRARRKTRPDE